MRQEVFDDMQRSLDSLKETVDRNAAACIRYEQTCAAILCELEQRRNNGLGTEWMVRHILNLRNALPPTIKPATMRKHDAGLAFRIGEAQAAQA